MRRRRRRLVDPPFRADGRCAICGRRLPSIAVHYLDPFCRTECARVWWDDQARALWAWWLVRGTKPKRKHRRKAA